MIQSGRAGIKVESNLQEAREQFQRSRVFRLPSLLDEKIPGPSFSCGNTRQGESSVNCQTTGPGDAICFEIAPDLEHMVTAVEGINPKTAFAGWFVGSDWHYYAEVRGLRDVA